MSYLSTPDLAALPAPQVLQAIDPEEELVAIKAQLITLGHENGLDFEPILQLESEPLSMLLEAFIYSAALLRGRINDTAKSLLLAFSQGEDLDHLAAFANVTRQSEESDDALRERHLASFAAPAAGSKKSYLARALKAYPEAASIGFHKTRDNAGRTIQHIVVAAAEGQTAPYEAVSAIRSSVTAEDAGPASDIIRVHAASIMPFDLHLKISIGAGPDANLIKSAAEKAVLAFVRARYGVGQSIPANGVEGAAYVANVLRVESLTPLEDITPDNMSAAWCTNLRIDVETLS